MRIYVIRHGESETNLSKKWTGWLDVHLTDQGKKDAQKAGTVLKHVLFDKIYTSDLSRAIETAQIAIPDCRYETSPLLREINVGSLANKPASILTHEQRVYTSKNGYAAFDGETKAEFQDRICRFMKELEELDYETIAVFSHGGFLRTMLDTVLSTQLPGEKICCNNCAIAIFESANKNWRLHSWINLS